MIYPSLYFSNFIPMTKSTSPISFISNLFLINCLVNSISLSFPAISISSTYTVSIHIKFPLLSNFAYIHGSDLSLLKPILINSLFNLLFQD